MNNQRTLTFAYFCFKNIFFAYSNETYPIAIKNGLKKGKYVPN